MRYATFCSGIEAPSVAWESLGWKAQMFSEIDAFPSALLKYRYPGIPNIGDMTKRDEVETYHERKTDLIIAGTPCQAFSVSGLRAGLGDDRSNLALEFCRILQEKRPRWFIWENVPGVLSSFSADQEESQSDGQTEWEQDETSDFSSIIAAFTAVGYGVAWRVLNSRYFGVAQKRRRVFVVGYLGDWRPSARVCFELDCLQGDLKARRKERKDNAPDIGGGIENTGPLKAQPGTCVDGMSSRSTSIYVPFAYSKSHREKGVVDIRFTDDGCANTLNTGDGCSNQSTMTIATNGQHVRKLTEIECERLMGLPDNWTKIPYRGKAAKDCPSGPRYKAIGNSIPVPFLKWLGERIQAADDFQRKMESMQRELFNA